MRDGKASVLGRCHMTGETKHARKRHAGKRARASACAGKRQQGSTATGEGEVEREREISAAGTLSAKQVCVPKVLIMSMNNTTQQQNMKPFASFFPQG